MVFKVCLDNILEGYITEFAVDIVKFYGDVEMEFFMLGFIILRYLNYLLDYYLPTLGVFYYYWVHYYHWVHLV